MRFSLVHRMNALGNEPDWRTDMELQRWCFKGGGGGGTSTSTTTSEPWAAQKPYLERGYQQAQQQLEGDKPQYLPGQTYVDQNPWQTQAYGQIAQRAQTGNPLVGQAQGQVSNTLQGQYLNPDISGVANSLDQQIRPRVGAQFATSGRNMSPAHEGAYTSNFANALAPYAYNANQAERGRMMDASQMAPGLAGADYADADRLAAVGGAQRAFGQEVKQDEINRFNFGQNVDAQKLQEYMGLISGGTGGGSSQTNSTQPTYSGK